MVRRSRPPRLKCSPLLFAKNISAKSFLRVLRYDYPVRRKENPAVAFALRAVVSAAPRRCAASVTKLPLIWQFLSSRIRRSPTGAVGITYALTSLRRKWQHFSARYLTFPQKRRYAQMWGAGAGKPCLRENLMADLYGFSPKKCGMQPQVAQKHA